jgi:serine/threonine-protein kinase
MGVVFEATHVTMDQRVAIKVLQPLVAQIAGVVSRFEREARAAGRLRGPHVARVTDVDVSPDALPYMVMELLQGHDDGVELEQRGPLPVVEAVEIVRQACLGITEAHVAGIIHRDLKPANLFLCEEEGQRVVKLLDFGISKLADEASKLTSTELQVGTLFYMSPEQVRSAKDVDTRTDIWALGVIMHELLAGDPPFVGSAPAVAAAIVTDEAPPLSELRSDVPEALAAIVRKAMSKRPSDRYDDVPAFAAAIAPYGAPPGPTSSARFLANARAASSSSLASSPRRAPAGTAALEHAETEIGMAAPPPASSPALGASASAIGVSSPAIGVSSPGSVARSASRGRRGMPWLALGGAALVVLGGLAALAFAGSSPSKAPAAPPPPPVTMTTLPPQATSPTASGPSELTPEPTAAAPTAASTRPTPATASAPPAAKAPQPGISAARPGPAPKPLASVPSGSSAPAPSTKKPEKAPLVAPF